MKYKKNWVMTINPKKVQDLYDHILNYYHWNYDSQRVDNRYKKL